MSDGSIRQYPSEWYMPRGADVFPGLPDNYEPPLKFVIKRSDCLATALKWWPSFRGVLTLALWDRFDPMMIHLGAWSEPEEVSEQAHEVRAYVVERLLPFADDPARADQELSSITAELSRRIRSVQVYESRSGKRYVNESLNPRVAVLTETEVILSELLNFFVSPASFFERQTARLFCAYAAALSFLDDPDQPERETISRLKVVFGPSRTGPVEQVLNSGAPREHIPSVLADEYRDLISSAPSNLAMEWGRWAIYHPLFRRSLRSATGAQLREISEAMLRKYPKPLRPGPKSKTKATLARWKVVTNDDIRWLSDRVREDNPGMDDQRVKEYLAARVGLSARQIARIDNLETP